MAAQLVSVTECLSILDRFGGIDPAVLRRAADLGTKVHQHCLGYLRGLYMPVPPEIKLYYDGFRRWADLAIREVIAVEVELKNKTLGLIGHADLIAELKSNPDINAVIDLKRTAAPPDWCVGLQLAAYQQLAPKKWRVGLRFALHATVEGKMHLYPYKKDDQDWGLFLSAMSLYNFSKR